MRKIIGYVCFAMGVVFLFLLISSLIVGNADPITLGVVAFSALVWYLAGYYLVKNGKKPEATEVKPCPRCYPRRTP